MAATTMKNDAPQTIDLRALLAEANVVEVIERLDAELVGLAPVKRRIHEIDDVLRECHGLAHDRLNEP